MKKLLLSLFCLLSPLLSQAQTFPQKPVKIVLSIGVGSAPDVLARKMSEVLSEKWKVPVIVENKPGGAGVIGLNHINNEPSDGYTLGYLESGTVVAYQALYKNSDPISKLEPLMPMSDAYFLLVTSSQITSFDNFKKELAKNPTYGSWNIGSAGHVLGAQLSSVYVDNAQHVPYKEFGVWQADISNQTVTFGFGSLGTTRALVEAGKNRWLATSGRHRDPNVPNIPTIKELTGQDIYSFLGWTGFYISKTTPLNIKNQLEKDLREAAADPRVQETMAKVGYVPLNKIPLKTFEKMVADDLKRYTDLLKKYNITVETAK